jgi:hypothetical protein
MTFSKNLKVIKKTFPIFVSYFIKVVALNDGFWKNPI